MENKDRWLKLDNAGKIFPYVSKKSFANVFRVSFYLKETINPEVLQNAVDDLKYRFPTFFVKMRTGIFWYYYELNERKFEVKKEHAFLCSYKSKNKNNGYLLDIFYYQNRISIEVFHAISDATGALELGKAVVYRYLELIGYQMEDELNEVIKVGSEPKISESVDSFFDNYNGEKLDRFKAPKAYIIKGTKFFAPGNGLIVGRVNSNDLKNLAKKYDCTVTQFISAVMLRSIYLYMKRHQVKNDKPLSIVLPVNMRKYYNSETLRNFALYIYLIQQVKPNLEFNDFIESIKSCYDEQLNIESLQATLNANMQIESSYALKLCPLFLKILACKIGYNKIAGGLSTISLSNIGIVKTPKSMEEYVDNVEFIAAGASTTHSCCVASFNNVTKISVTRIFQGLDIEREFFKFLSQLGLEVIVSSNLWEEN